MNDAEINEQVDRARKIVEDAQKAYTRALVSYMRIVIFRDTVYISGHGTKELLQMVIKP